METAENVFVFVFNATYCFFLLVDFTIKVVCFINELVFDFPDFFNFIEDVLEPLFSFIGQIFSHIYHFCVWLITAPWSFFSKKDDTKIDESQLFIPATTTHRPMFTSKEILSFKQFQDAQLNLFLKDYEDYFDYLTQKDICSALHYIDFPNNIQTYQKSSEIWCLLVPKDKIIKRASDTPNRNMEITRNIRLCTKAEIQSWIDLNPKNQKDPFTNIPFFSKGKTNFEIHELSPYLDAKKSPLIKDRPLFNSFYLQQLIKKIFSRVRYLETKVANTSIQSYHVPGLSLFRPTTTPANKKPELIMEASSLETTAVM